MRRDFKEFKQKTDKEKNSFSSQGFCKEKTLKILKLFWGRGRSFIKGLSLFSQCLGISSPQKRGMSVLIYSITHLFLVRITCSFNIVIFPNLESGMIMDQLRLSPSFLPITLRYISIYSSISTVNKLMSEKFEHQSYVCKLCLPIQSKS